MAFKVASYRSILKVKCDRMCSAWDGVGEGSVGEPGFFMQTFLVFRSLRFDSVGSVRWHSRTNRPKWTYKCYYANHETFHSENKVYINQHINDKFFVRFVQNVQCWMLRVKCVCVSVCLPVPLFAGDGVSPGDWDVSFRFIFCRSTADIAILIDTLEPSRKDRRQTSGGYFFWHLFCCWELWHRFIFQFLNETKYGSRGRNVFHTWHTVGV